MQSNSEHDKQDLTSSQKASKSKNPFAKKRKQMKTLEASKKERGKKTKEDKERRKKMDGMDENEVSCKYIVHLIIVHLVM